MSAEVPDWAAMSGTEQKSQAPEELGTSLLGAMLRGLLERPTLGDELVQAPEGPTCLEPLDRLDEVRVGVKVESQAVVHEGEGDGQTFASARRAGEQKGSSGHGKKPDPSFHATVVDLEAPICEAASKEGSLVDGIGRGATQRGLGQELRVFAASVRDGCAAAPLASEREANDGRAEIHDRKNSGDSEAS
jgi:hypothetical protein